MATSAVPGAVPSDRHSVTLPALSNPEKYSPPSTTVSDCGLSPKTDPAPGATSSVTAFVPGSILNRPNRPLLPCTYSASPSRANACG